jgi:hypothetical protein
MTDNLAKEGRCKVEGNDPEDVTLLLRRFAKGEQAAGGDAIY